MVLGKSYGADKDNQAYVELSNHLRISQPHMKNDFASLLQTDLKCKKENCWQTRQLQTDGECNTSCQIHHIQNHLCIILDFFHIFAALKFNISFLILFYIQIYGSKLLTICNTFFWFLIPNCPKYIEHNSDAW